MQRVDHDRGHAIHAKEREHSDSGNVGTEGEAVRGAHLLHFVHDAVVSHITLFGKPVVPEEHGITNKSILTSIFAGCTLAARA